MEDKNTYTVEKKNPEKTLERKLNKLMKKWGKKKYVSSSEYHHLRSSDASLPRAYAVPKIYKINVPYRIIVSSVNTALYTLAGFLGRIISDRISKARGHINNSFELYKKLSGVEMDESGVLISLNITSLFINIPLALAIDGIEKRWKYIKNNKITKRCVHVCHKFRINIYLLQV